MKTALVTGTSSGLGLDLSNFLLDKGWKVIGISRRKSDLKHENYFHYRVDIANKLEIIELFAQLQTETIDLLVHNAAIFKMREFENSDLGMIDSIINTNLKAPMYITKFALQHMPPGSRIIFINSVAGLEELEKQSIYCASKSGLTVFAGVLGKEIQKKGIKVSSIHPGGINTPLWNDNNPYPCGDVNLAMSTYEICKVIGLIIDSNNNIKTIKLFPQTEWH